MNDFHDLHFLRPDVLYLFIPFLILFVLILSRKRKASLWESICSKDLLPYIVEKKIKRHFFFFLTLFLTFSLLLIALAGPTWNSISIPLIKTQSGLVIALDLSNAMNAEDVKPSRLQRAIYKINDILDQRQEGQTALIVFSSDTFTVTPLTDDVETIKAMLPALDPKIMPISGHKVNKAILKASELLTQAGVSNGSVLILTTELTNKDLEKSIKVSKATNTKVHILGIGTEEGAPIPKSGGGFVANEKGALVLSVLAKANLQKLAYATDGSYLSMSKDDSDINHFHDLLAPDTSNNSQSESEQIQKKWHDQGYLLVLLSLPFFVLVFRRGILVIVLFLVPHGIQASLWEDLWQTRDQQAEQFFHKEDYQQATDLFENEDWKASSNYKLKNYEAAAELYNHNTNADGFYNFGTAKAKAGKYDEALQAYQKALELQPDHEDALYNKKLIEDLQNQQKDQKKNQDKDDKDDKEDKNNNDNQQKDDQNSSDKENDKSEKSKPENANDDKQNSSNEDKSNASDVDKDNQSQDGKEEEKKSSNKPQETSENPNEKEQQDYKNQVEKEMQEKKDQQENAEVSQADETSPEDPQRTADDRWLQRVKDDPGGLLKRKFQLQYRQSRTNSNGDDE
jgi:Ca-activated chloride channel family protein